MRRRCVARATLGIAVALSLTACGDGADSSSETSAAPDPTDASTSDAPSAPTDDPTTEPATEAGSDPTPEPTSEPASESSSDPDEGGFTVTTPAGGTELSVEVPDGWDAYGADEAIIEYDLITVTRGAGPPEDPLYYVVFSDFDVGLDAAGTRDVLREEAAAASWTESVVDLDAITIDGVEFGGFEAVQQGPTTRVRSQNWIGELDDTVLNIYISSTHGDEELPSELFEIRDSLTIAPAAP